MPIRTKLALGLSAILALNLLASLYGFHRLTQAASREAEILETSSDILTLALTALAMPGDREQCLEAGMDDYLTKPLGFKELHATVAQWVARTRTAAARALS
jgi:CheY-like chemotaxis protein